MFRSFSILLLLTVFFSLPLGAQPTLQKDLNLDYLVQLPTITSKKPPVLILMHGYGSNEADLFELKEVLPKNFVIISLRAPLKMGENSFQWFRIDQANGSGNNSQQDLDASAAAVKKMISSIVKKYSADPSRVYLSGFSQGGMMCYEVGLTSPHLLRGIAPLSGKIFESLKPKVQQSSALKQLKVFIGHGNADTRVAYSLSVAANNYLKQIGLTPEFHTYKGVQHSISQEELVDLVNWLNK